MLKIYLDFENISSRALSVYEMKELAKHDQK
jgi:hypothetical protein